MKMMDVFGFLFLFVIFGGGIVSIIRFKIHKKPNETKIYKLNVMDLVAKLYISVPFFFLTIIFTTQTIHKIFTESYYYSFVLIISIITGFLSIPYLILFKQYYYIERGRMIEFDPINRKIIIKKQGVEQVILNTDITIVEYFGAWPAKDPFEFEYLKIILNDGSKYILTNLLNDLSDFEPIFKGVKKKYHETRIYNKINWG